MLSRTTIRESRVGQLSRGGERLARGLYKAFRYFSNPAERFDNLVYAYGQIGYLNAVLQGLLFTANNKGSQ